MSRHPDTAVTYYPSTGMVHEGDFTSHVDSNPMASVSFTPRPNMDHAFDAHTRLYSPELRRASQWVASHRGHFGLQAATYDNARDELDHLTLIRLYNQLRGELQRWFHLDEMFQKITVDKLLLRMAFRGDPARAQRVGAREPYDVARLQADEIQFDLGKIVTSFDIAIEDPMRTMIDPIGPLQENDAFALAYKREFEAAAALKNIGNYYTKSASGEAQFNATTLPADTDAARISKPDALTAGNVHSDKRTANQIHLMRVAFLRRYSINLTHFAMSPMTIQTLAQNTWTNPNTIFNVENYRTVGGVLPMPGITDAIAVVSPALEDNVIYAASKPSGVLLLAEGPKITKTWYNNIVFTQQTAHLDFVQYKCAHEDLKKITRRFACILPLHGYTP